MQRVLPGVTAIGFLLAVGGALVLLAYAASEVLADASLSLEDAYWIGRLPWTPIGVGLVVLGSTLSISTGLALVLVRGGNVRRLVALAASAPAAFWWAIDLLQLQGVSGACPRSGDCTRPWTDPITNAYSLPMLTVFLLLLPSMIVAAVALAPSQARRRSAYPST